jgi:hypothetical protein
MRPRTTIAAAAIATFAASLGLALTATPAAAADVRVLPKVSSTTLKKNCETGGGTYAENTHGSYWCSLNDGEHIVLCPKNAKNCYGLTPSQLRRLDLDLVTDSTEILTMP